MLSKNQIKLIISLQKKKHRDSNQLYVAEGNKLVMDLLNSGAIAEYLIYSKEWKNQYSIGHFTSINSRIETDLHQIKKISNLKTPAPVLAVFRIPKTHIDSEKIQKSISLVLDDIQDPGNLGTIIRIADWFGIEQIFCSHNTVDLYNPKVIQATMGAISRVGVQYVCLKDLLLKYQAADFPIYGTFLEGDNIYKCTLQNKGFIIMGNEGKGVSQEISDLVTKKLFIPNYPTNQETSESLNVSVATAILCSEFRRLEF